MKTQKFIAAERGKKDFGWLKANYSFSFADYYNPESIHFGKLRVLNDDIISAGMGFAPHEHANMEIISIPLKGALKHKDSTGKSRIIRPNEVQIMSAGTGIEHSEKNHIKNGETSVLQIWILPKEFNTEPKYQQQYFDPHHRQNKWQALVSNKHLNALDINQDAAVSRVNLKAGEAIDYTMSYEGNGVYLFVVSGAIHFQEEQYFERDAIGIEQTNQFTIKALKDADVLALEVPMN